MDDVPSQRRSRHGHHHDDHAIAVLVTTPSCRTVMLQFFLLASHQLFTMTMASHHRRRLRTDPSDNIAPSSIFLAASHRVSLQRHRTVVVAASHCRLLLAASHRNHLFARHHTGEDLLVVDDAVAAPDTTVHHLVVVDAVAAPDTTMHHLVVVDAVTAPITTSSCRTQQPPLDVDGAFATPITTPSSPRGIAPKPAISGTAPLPAITSHRRPPPHMESTASPPSQPLPPPSTTAATIAAGTVVAATDQQGSDANCWRRLLAAPLLLLPRVASHNSLLPLTQFSCVFSQELSHEHTHTRTHIPRKRNGFARDTPLVNHNGYMVSLLSPLGLTSLLSMQHVYIHQVLDSRTHYQPP